ncbi:hypothetical protein PQ692_00420 [Thermoanaerobacterium thermosaccharolyticum]|uniref:hypothetical protein n=1 Tax=Thermoanaerobacterium thermosaccharolyticum TaxID=1517 RepID=UPI003DA9007F
MAIMIEEGTTNLLPTNMCYAEPDASAFGGTTRDSSKTYGGKSSFHIVGNWTASAPIPVTPGQPITISAFVQTATAGGQFGLWFYDSSGAYVGAIATGKLSDSAITTWARKSVSGVVPNNAATMEVFFASVDFAPPGNELWIVWICVEYKPYPTTQTDGTRAAETLTIPTAGVLSAQRGEVAILRRMDIASNNPPSGVYRNIFSLKGVVWGIFVPNGAANEIQWAVGGWSSLVRATITWDAGDWLWIFAEWDLPNATLHVYNVTKGTHVYASITNAVSVTVPSLAYVGCADGSNFNAHCNGLIDDLRISSRARTEEEILATYQSGEPLPVDEWTTWKSSFDGHLRNEVPVREYGLWVGKGKIQGTVMHGNEIYSSSFSTRNPGETKAYAEINTEGDIRIYDPFGKLGMLIYGGVGQGTIKWYLDGIEYATANIDAGDYQDLWIRTSRSDSGIRLETYKGQYIQIGSGGNSSIEIKAGTSGTVYVYSTMVVDDFYVTGTKDAVQETENYGYRSLTARESPEAKYVDEGKACLVNGECRIELDPIFLECIEPNTSETPWLFHLTPLAPLNLYVAEIGETYFVVKDVNNALEGEFCWAVSGTRKGYAGRRFIEHKLEDIKPKQNET